MALKAPILACVECRLETLGVGPDLARATFDNFEAHTPELANRLEAVRAFAHTGKGVLLLLGCVGAGKTHLAVAAARQRLEDRPGSVALHKHRRFVADHRQSLRPVPFGDEPVSSPLWAAQRAPLLVYDELTSLDAQRGEEDLLLDLLEHRIEYYLPTILTSNLAPADLESALGSRLLDRLRPCVTMLPFGFESHRRRMRDEYARRAAAFTTTIPAAQPVCTTPPT